MEWRKIEEIGVIRFEISHFIINTIMNDSNIVLQNLQGFLEDWEKEEDRFFFILMNGMKKNKRLV